METSGSLCTTTGCKEPIFAACDRCDCLLCFTHFNDNNECVNHNEFANLIFHNEQEQNLVSQASACVTLPVPDTMVEISPSVPLIIENLTAVPNDHDIDPPVTALPTDFSSSDLPTGASTPTTGQPSVSSRPEDFVVEGGDAELEIPCKVVKVNHFQENQRKRNNGETYTSNATGKVMRGRKDEDKPRCNGHNEAVVWGDKFQCEGITDECRKQIRYAYWEQGSIQRQREWISRHIQVSEVSRPNPKGRKNRSISYFLPSTSSQTGTLIPVCKTMFLNTVNISARAITTTINKMKPEGTIEADKRGGRRNVENDKAMTKRVTEHINRFPRVESHYCRSSSSRQYLSCDLNVNRMHMMYQQEYPENTVSLSFYTKIFKSMNLAFHLPKKDLCGLCASYHLNKESGINDEDLNEEYQNHILEKDRVRQIKDEEKERSLKDPSKVTCCFDLQQVIYLPKSDWSEIFYKRRLGCYNFTIFDVASKDGFCFLSHEGTTKRGSNEIATSLYTFLEDKDRQGAQEITMFSDGCPGQNKNTIVPTRMMYFIQTSQTCQTVTLNFFEPYHGQCEGDSMHSTIEREMRVLREVFLPAQLATAFALARKYPNKPYHVREMLSSDILDWKELSTAVFGQGNSRVKETDDGQLISWKTFKAVKGVKATPDKVYVKMSHFQDFKPVTLGARVRSNKSKQDVSKLPKPKQAYTKTKGVPKLAQAKYTDLMQMVNGPRPLIRNPEHVAFYKNLPHE